MVVVTKGKKGRAILFVVLAWLKTRPSTEGIRREDRNAQPFPPYKTSAQISELRDRGSDASEDERLYKKSPAGAGLLIS